MRGKPLLHDEKIIREVVDLFELIKTLLNQEEVRVTRERCWIEIQTLESNICTKRRLSIQRQLHPSIYRVFFSGGEERHCEKPTEVKDEVLEYFSTYRLKR